MVSAPNVQELLLCEETATSRDDWWGGKSAFTNIYFRTLRISIYPKTNHKNTFSKKTCQQNNAKYPEKDIWKKDKQPEANQTTETDNVSNTWKGVIEDIKSKLGIKTL